ncbi:fasciclin domain-containing protein [Imtechella halotolerans]|uniref:fasciclin domain-containing protein n=1 Tax=Imtechella halotolerans TaxID=1165090 RepID=UPI002366B3AC|nr:fasciclin domain-containing protein [Imtechella halotolerans]WMQ64019.1 fasciclin domain-containing protein [Imtechella halotolerans]
MKKRLFQLSLICFSLLFVSCSDDDDDKQMTIADYVASSANYSSLKAALDRAGLTATLDASTSFTVFAPDNAAFSAFLEDNGFASLNDVPVGVLTEVLLNHVVVGVNRSSSLTTGYVKTLAKENTTDNEIDMYINTEDGVLINGQSSVVAADIDVSNGVIHAVDKVIGLPTVVTFATADATFSTLVAALTADPGFTYVTTLSSTTAPAPFTVFAPTNTAFGNLLTELGANSLGDIPIPTVQATLNTHVIAGANVLSSSLTNGMTVTTLGDSFTINLGTSATFTDLNGRTGNIVVTDVQASNGVIHVVDKVILPQLD